MLVNFDGRLEINDDEAPRLALPEDLIQKRSCLRSDPRKIDVCLMITVSQHTKDQCALYVNVLEKS